MCDLLDIDSILSGISMCDLSNIDSILSGISMCDLLNTDSILLGISMCDLSERQFERRRHGLLCFTYVYSLY